MSSVEIYKNMNRFQLAKVIAEKFNLIEGYGKKSKDYYLSLLEGKRIIPKPLKSQLIKQALIKNPSLKEKEIKKESYEKVRILVEGEKEKKVETDEDYVSILINFSSFEVKEFYHISPVRDLKKLKNYTTYSYNKNPSELTGFIRNKKTGERVKVSAKEEIKDNQDFRYLQMKDKMDDLTDSIISGRKFNPKKKIYIYEKDCILYNKSKDYDYEEIKEELLKKGMSKSEYLASIIRHSTIKIKAKKQSNYTELIRKELFHKLENYAELNGYRHSIIQGSININIFKVGTKDKLQSIKMQKEQLQYKSIENQKMIIKNDGECVLDAILFELAGKYKFKTLNREKLISQFQTIDANILTEGISTEDIYNWAVKYTDCVSIYAVNCLNQLFFKYKATNQRYSIVYKLNGNHCYLITDEEKRNNVIRSISHSLDAITFDPVITEDNYILIDCDNLTKTQILEKINTKYDKDNLILCNILNLNRIATMLVLENEYYIENLNFSNGYLMGLINPKNGNKVIINNDIKACFKITEELFKITGNPIHRFTNQSLSSLSKMWFEEIYGNLKNSIYSDRVLNSIDKFGVSPLVQESIESIKRMPVFDNFEEEVKFMEELQTCTKFEVDICKCYSSSLINNEIGYPVYTVFDEWTEYIPSETILETTDNKYYAGLELVEKVDLNKLRLIVENFEQLYTVIGDSFDIRSRKRSDFDGTLTQLKKTLLKKESTNKVKYFYSNDRKEGRLFSNNSLQGISRKIRQTIANDYYYDIDMENAHVKILSWYCSKNNINCEHVNYYVNNVQKCRSDVMEALNISKDDAKKLLLSHLNYAKDLNEEQIEKCKNISWLRSYCLEMKHIHKQICDLNEELFNITCLNNKDDFNVYGKTVNKVFCVWENNILQEMYKFATKQGVRVASLCFDGMMLYKEDVSDLNKLLDDMMKQVYKTIGIDIKITHKEMTEVLDLSGYHIQNIKYESDDDIKEYPFVGEYIINRPINIPFLPKSIHQTKYNAVLVKFLIENNYISHSDIQFHLKPSYVYKSSHFKSFTYEIYDKFGIVIGKKLINSFTGMIGKKWNNFQVGAMCDSYDTVSAIYNDLTNSMMKKDIINTIGEDNNMDKEFINGMKIDIENLGGIYYIKQTSQERLLQDNIPIYTQIVSNGIVQILTLAREVNKYKNTQIDYIYTDAIGFKVPFENDEDRYLTEKEQFSKLNISVTENALDFGKYRKCRYGRKGIYKIDIKKDTEFNPILCDIKKNTNILTEGRGGTGKSTLLVKEYKEDVENKLNVLVCTPTAVARDTLIQRGIEIARDFDETFIKEMGLYIWLAQCANLNKIYVDEIYMLNKKWITFLVLLNRKYQGKISIRAYGDSFQCLPVEVGTGNTYDYTETSVFNELFTNKRELEYIEASARYDMSLKTEIDFFNRTSTFNKINLTKDVTNFNVFICKKNDTKKRVDKFMMEKVLNQSNDFKLTIPYKGCENWKQTVTLCKGMKVVCRNNNILNESKTKVSNSSFLNIVNLNEEEIEMKFVHFTEKPNIKISPLNFHENYELAYCNTVYRYQSATISDPFLILDPEIMYKKEMYTAITRGQKLSDVNIYDNIKGYYNDKIHIHEITVLNEIEKKIKGIIFKVSNTVNNITYIDTLINVESEDYIKLMTDKYAKSIKKKVLNDFEKAIKEYGIDKFKIELIYNGFFQRRKDIEKLQDIYIEKEEETYNQVNNILIKIKENKKVADRLNMKQIITDKYAPKILETDDRIKVVYYKEGKRSVKEFRKVKNEKEAYEKANEFMKKL